MPTITDRVVPLQAKVPYAVAQRLRIAAAARNVPARDILIEALDEWFSKHPVELPPQQKVRRAS